MKIAGQKNQGAWFRFNKFLRTVNGEESNRATTFLANLKGDLGLLELTGQFRGYLNTFLGGLSDDFNATMSAYSLPATTEAQLSQWIDTGIPWQVWSGEWSYDNYVKVKPGDGYPDSEEVNTKDYTIYVKQNGNGMRKLAHKLRKQLTAHKLRYRQLLDMTNVELSHHINPGGRADAIKN